MINKQHLEKYITHPENLSLSTIHELEKLVEAFPYFQTAQLLYVKNLGKEHNIHYNQRLRIAAAYAGDRAILKKLVEQASPGPAAGNETRYAMKQPADTQEPDQHESGKKTSDNDSVKDIHDNAGNAGLSEQEEKQTDFSKPKEDFYANDTESSVTSKTQESHKTGESVKSDNSFAETPAARRKRELEQLKREMDELKKERQTIDKVIREEEQRRMQRQRKTAFHSKLEYAEEQDKPDRSHSISNSNDNKTSFSDADSQSEGKDIHNKKSAQKTKQELIDNFIREEPSIKRTSSVFYDPTEAARKSILQPDDIATETLARIYRKQGKVLQAIKIYEKLSLKFPQKSDYFANQIQEIKKTNK